MHEPFASINVFIYTGGFGEWNCSASRWIGLSHVGATPKTFGITSIDRSSWAGEYAKEEGRMLATIIEQKYDISDERFATFRQKVPAEITDVKVDKVKQTITFEGYEYEYTYFLCFCKRFVIPTVI